MNHRLIVLLAAVSVLPLLCVTPMNSSAQQKKAVEELDNSYAKNTGLKPLPPGGPTPRTADGHPDLSGIWFSGLLGTEDATLVGSYGESDPATRAFDPKVTPEEKPSFTPWAAAKLKEMMFNLDPNILRQYGITYTGATSPGEVNFDKLPLDQKKAFLDVEIARISRDCMPFGVPGIGGGLHGMQFVQTPGQLVQLVDANHDFRVIPTDGQPHTKDPDPKFNGEERGHWEGDVLVIDTIAIDERVWNSATWRFHSDQEHVIERYSRPSKNYLTYEVTIDDPKVLTKPWRSAPHRFTLSVNKEPLGEWYCGVEPNEALEHIKELRQQLGN
ncbi:MAG TPA: hypothetical protein VFB23_09180 [Candidatus Acidoferrales bacterium]|nr:hypothetical protein [Candidatus Acidoferrales bacterium]